jgi:hypothetical protein
LKIVKHILSKSTYLYGCQCTKRLYLHKHKPQLKNPVDEEQISIFSAGTNIGILAHALFPGGSNAEPPDPFSYHISVAKTQELIAAGVEIIYEAAFMFDGVLCAMDMLVKQNGKWYAYEVKGTTGVKQPHIDDASLQHFVITKAGIPLEDIFIVHLNNQYVRKGELNIQELFTVQSIKKEIALTPSWKISAKIKELKEVIFAGIEPMIEPDDHCYKPYECDFTQHCWQGIAVETKPPAKKYIDQKYIGEFIAGLTYPLYFFDFETVMPSVPEYDHSRPYQQIPFQYSLHIQEKSNGELMHKEFLGDGVNDPRVHLIEQLIHDLGNTGSILVWNQTFELSRLKEIARDFPQYANAIEKLIPRIVDLMVPFRNKSIVFPEFNHSYSIKNILPVLVPDLSYKDLVVQEGGTASLMYASLKDQEPEVQLEHREQLLAYCHLDTLAMSEILNVLPSLINKP